MIAVGNAPCSWGSLEFEGLENEPVAYAQMLDELAETGYTGSELGDWGYMPTDSAMLAAAFLTRKLVLTGAFVPVALKDPAAHEAGIEAAVRTATLLAQAASRIGVGDKPFLVLADNNGSVEERTRNAGRITARMSLSTDEWRVFADGANRIAAAVQEKTGLRTVFHHHCAGYVETDTEIRRFLRLTDPKLIGLVFDTGHYAFGNGGSEGMAEALDRYSARIEYIHFKDCHADVMEQARQKQWDYFEAMKHGVFCELGKGCVDFAAVLHWLEHRRYDGYITVEQDVLPGMGTARESAQRNRAYLRTLGL